MLGQCMTYYTKMTASYEKIAILILKKIELGQKQYIKILLV